MLRRPAVACRGVSRGGVLDRLSLTVPAGVRLLLVGEPDESASALVRVLAGLSPIDRGRVEIAGLRHPSTEGCGRRVAHLGPEPGIHAWMTPREALALAARLLRLGADESKRRIERSVAWTRIPAGSVDRPVGRGGPPLLQRVGLAAALLGDPEVLLLDEPLRALEGKERARLLRLPGRRRTVILASHYPASEAGLATHVALLREGRVVLRARIAALAAAGLPLSHRGIATLAELRAAERGAGGVERPLAAAR